MLIACPDCHRQFEIEADAVGSTVRCFCGHRIPVTAPSAREIRMQHCASCGAGLQSGAKSCGFCKSAVSLAERGLGDVCPECMHRLVRDARFCSSCGVGIQPAQLQKTISDRQCPRCSVPMAACNAGQVSFSECESCGGLWLDEATVKSLVADREKSAAPAILAATEGHARDDDDERLVERRVTYIPCPVCRELMNRQNFGAVSGIVLDWCRGHGFWFDARELEAVFEFVRNGGIEKSRQREIEALERKRREALHAANVRLDRVSMGSFLDRARPADPLSTLVSWLARLLS